MGTRWTAGARIAGVAASAVAAGLITLLSAPIAGAEPADPVLDPAVPDTAVVAPVVPLVAAADPAEGVPHLPSPENLPPGTTQDAPEHPTAGYLRDVWHALRSHDVSMSDALLLIAQRPMSATPPAGMSPRPAQSTPAEPVPAPESPVQPAPPAEPGPTP